MVTAIKTYLGFAKQDAQSTVGTSDAKVVTDNLFKYILWSRGVGLTPAEVVAPLPQEMGAGALTREMDKLAVSVAGGFEFIPRPDSIVQILRGLLGDLSTATGVPVASANTHTVKFATNEFELPWWTWRRLNPSWGETFTDCRVQSLALTMNAASRVAGTVGILGITPEYVAIADTATWDPDTYLDTGPTLLTCTGVAELPDGTKMQARTATLQIVNVINVANEMAIGQYTPVGLDVVSRMAMITFTAPASAALYKKLQYTTGAGTAWDATVYAEANLDLTMKSTEFVTGTTPYSLTIKANSRTEAQGDANLLWSVAPIGHTPADKLMLVWTGYVLEDKSGATDGPLSFQIVNNIASY